MSFWRERFARPAWSSATGGPELAAEARRRAPRTVHWDMYLRKRVGTPSDPADPALIERRADALFDYAVSVTGCQTPLIALNELWGASLPTPLTPTADRYRANVLRFVSRLAERGGRPALLVSSEPFTGGDAAAWWRSIAEAARDLARTLPGLHDLLPTYRCLPTRMNVVALRSADVELIGGDADLADRPDAETVT